MNNIPPRRRPLMQREQELYRLLVNCQLGMPPEVYVEWFRRKYQISNFEIARIARVSEPTVERWFFKNENRSIPKSSQTFFLAVMDLLWSHYEEIPQSMWDWLCPPDDSSADEPREL
jgi:hypothetical protein